ncbi:MAG TPA: MarR family transcriptional regulator [Fimbriimonas sp.]
MRKQHSPRRSLSEAQRRSWKALFIVSHLVSESIDDALARAGLDTQPEYDLLYTLQQAPGGTLTLKELAASMTLSHSGLSRMVDRLEKRGYVARCGVETDKRAVGIRLLDVGAKRVSEVWGVVSATLQERYAGALTEAEHKELLRLIEKVAHPLIEAKEKETGLPFLHRL